MRLVIMTRGRVHKQETLKYIPSDWRPLTYFVCPPEEADQLEEMYRIQTIPFFHDSPNYSNKFQFILERIGPACSDGKIMILDDDLAFADRTVREDGKVSFRTTRVNTPEGQESMSRMFESVRLSLDEVPHVGIHSRQMADRAPHPYKENGKVIVANAVNVMGLRELGFPDKWRVDYAPILADTFLNCYVLCNGGKNRLLTDWVVNWGPSQAPGGCEYRTMQMQEDAIDLLVGAFTPFVKKVVKTPVAAKWLGDSRVDFRVQWKAMAEYYKK